MTVRRSIHVETQEAVHKKGRWRDDHNKMDTMRKLNEMEEIAICNTN